MLDKTAMPRHEEPGYYALADLPQRQSVAEIAISTGWWELDQIFKLYPGQFVVVTGIPGHGKSTLLLNIICNVWAAGIKSFLYVPENEGHIREKLSLIWGDSRPGWEVFSNIGCFVQCSVPDTFDQEPHTLDWLLNKAVRAVKEDGVKILLIDPWNEIEHAKPKEMAMTDYIRMCIMWIKQFCRMYSVTVIMVAHPTKAGVVDGKVPTLSDIEGSMNWYNKCDNGLIVVRDPSSNSCKVISAKVRLHAQLESGLPFVFADAGQMEQVMMNLVLNARDAMPAGGSIIVRTARRQLAAALQHRFGVVPPGDYVTLVVKDCGNGMAPEVVERLFEPFFTTKPQGKGTGLGLATVHGIVLQSSGHITVESAPGQGAEFTVYLPAHQTTLPDTTPLPIRGPARQVGRTVLVVDDEAAVRDVTMRAVARAGYRVLGAGGGAQALDLLSRESDPSAVLLLTDIMMPEMSGHELAMRVAERFPAVRVATMSGYSADELTRRGHLAHPQLLKPFTLPQLIAFVNDAFAAERAVA